MRAPASTPTRLALAAGAAALVVLASTGHAAAPGVSPTPLQDWAASAKADRQKAAAALGEYAPVPNEPGKYHVPVARAMDIVAADAQLLKPIALNIVVSEDPVERGSQIFNKLQPCYTCHAVSAADQAVKLGPRLHGRFGGQAKIMGGTTVTFDEAYVKSSIQNPLGQVADGFPPVMPPLGLSDEQIADVAAYLKSLK